MGVSAGLDHGVGHVAYSPHSRSMGLNVGCYTRKIVHSGKVNHQVNLGGEGGKVL